LRRKTAREEEDLFKVKEEEGISCIAERGER
jgi:hypothetical protein